MKKPKEWKTKGVKNSIAAVGSKQRQGSALKTEYFQLSVPF